MTVNDDRRTIPPDRRLLRATSGPCATSTRLSALQGHYGKVWHYQNPIRI